MLACMFFRDAKMGRRAIGLSIAVLPGLLWNMFYCILEGVRQGCEFSTVLNCWKVCIAAAGNWSDCILQQHPAGVHDCTPREKHRRLLPWALDGGCGHSIHKSHHRAS